MVLFSAALLVSSLVGLTQSQSYTTKVWEGSDNFFEDGYAFPETLIPDIGAGPSNGICFPGGGNRAFTSATGWLRALHELDLLPEITYLSSVSGGTWASSSFLFRQAYLDTSKFLGPVVSPQKLTLQFLNTTPENDTMLYSMSVANQNQNASNPEIELAEAFIGIQAILNATKDSAKIELIKLGLSSFWEDFVQRIFFDHLNVPTDHFFSWNKETVQEITSRNPDLSADRFILPMNGTNQGRLPFPVMAGTTIGPLSLAPLIPNPEYNTLSGFDMTPLYAGTSYQKSIMYRGQDGDSREVQQGGLIESFAFGSTPPANYKSMQRPSNPNNFSIINVTQPLQPFALKVAAGISSMFLGVTLAESSQKTPNLFNLTGKYSAFRDDLFYLVPSKNMFSWPPSTDSLTQTKTLFADGGSLDNSGVINLVRRNVRNIVVFDCSAEPLLSNSNLYTLFGLNLTSPSVINIGAAASNNQIFSQSSYTEVINQLQKDGIAQVSLLTVENDWWGVIANQSVEFTWVALNSTENFLNSLPQDTVAELEKGEAGLFPSFPRYSTTEQFYLTDPQANLLSHLTTDILLSNADKIKNGLGLVPPTRTTTAPPIVDNDSSGNLMTVLGALVAVVLLLSLAFGCRTYFKFSKNMSRVEDELRIVDDSEVSEFESDDGQPLYDRASAATGDQYASY